MVSDRQAAHCLAVPQNEKAQTITTNCERILKWNDMFLRSDDAFETMVITTTRHIQVEPVRVWQHNRDAAAVGQGEIHPPPRSSLILLQIWVPDIVLYNFAGRPTNAGTGWSCTKFLLTGGSRDNELNTFLQVRYDGSVVWLTQGMYVSKCEIDVKGRYNNNGQE